MSSSNNNINGNDQPKTLSRQQKRYIKRQLGRFPPIDCIVELDRKNRIYFPGEVVTGLVRLKVPPSSSVEQQQLCRGVYWKLLAKSHVLWVEGSGDSEVLRYGDTIFQHERRTLLGPYHRSFILSGNNIMVIPCSRQQRQQQLVVQAVTFNPRKKETKVFGEILVDLKDFDNSSGPRSYPLLINKKQTEIFLSGEWETESLHGRDEASECFRLCVHKLVGVAQVLQVRVHLSMEASLPKQDKSTNDDETVLPQGETVFPFRFKIREDSPGSANWVVPSRGRAYVSFAVSASVDMKLARNNSCPSSVELLTVFSNHPKPLPALLSPFHAEKLDQIMHSCHCLRSGKRDGLVSIRLALARLAFAPGEAVELMGSQVTNDASVALPLRIILRCHIERRHLPNTDIIPNKVRRDFVLLEAEVPGKQTVLVKSLAGSSEVRIPAVFPSFGGGVEEVDSVTVPELPSKRFACLRWSYTLEIRVGGDKRDWVTGIYCRTPVLICTAPPYAAQVEAARHQRHDLQELMGPMSIFEYAATRSQEDCDTAPALGGPDGGGTLVVAEQSGSNWTGDFKNQWKEILQHQLELGQAQRIDLEPFISKAIVHSFDPGASPVVELYGSQGAFETSEPKSQSSASAHLESSNPPVGSATSGLLDLEELLLAMEDSPDNRAIVHNWVRCHPDKAHQLLPQHVAAIVSRVTFSLDRMEILKELVTALNMQNALTCEHILVVMDVCPFEKAEVARLMAPSANDPENKERVLNQIEWQLEREAVDRLFPSAAGR